MAANGEGPNLPRTERVDAPAYLARYQQRRQARRVDEPADDSVPLYLRRFRERREGESVDGPPASGLPYNPKLVKTLKSKEIIAPPEHKPSYVVTIRLIRHGETQGYTTESGLTPRGAWAAHRRGLDHAKSIDGERVRIVCADTARARQTAEHMYRGVLDGLEQWGHTADVTPPEPIAELANFRFATPTGMRDVTAAYREFHATLERYEREAIGERPLWMVEFDRFFHTQLGGADPIYHWLTIPMLHFEPPVSCVRRFWSAILRIAEETPGARVLAPTHSGPIRAFATWAHGYDAGEPYNLEEVAVSVKSGLKEALVAYRNRVTPVHVPPVEELPIWEMEQRAATVGS